MTVAAARNAGYRLPAYCSDGFLIPYPDERGELTTFWRWRNNKQARKGFARLAEKQPKYAQEDDSGNELYIPRVRGLDWERIFGDPKQQVFIVEGELKALSLCVAGIPTVALGGVWNSRNKIRELLHRLKRLAAGGRSLVILFDSDIEDNPLVLGAAYDLSRALLDADGRPKIIRLPHEEDRLSPEKTGADDYRRLHPELNSEALRDSFLEHADELAEMIELQRLNAQYVIVETAARIVRLFDRDGHEADRKTERWTRADFGMIESTKIPILKRDGKSYQLKPIGQVWIEWPMANRVVGQFYEPVKQGEHYIYTYQKGRRYLNQFRGWNSVPKAKSELIEKYWTALLDTLFHQQKEETAQEEAQRLKARTYFEQWLAYPVQNPGIKMMVAVLVSGPQGAGKDMVGRALGAAVYGAHYRPITSEDLERSFNASFTEAASFIHAEELTNKTNKKNFNELLKAFITSPIQEINDKYEKVYYAPARFNLYMTTNPEDSVQVEEGDRRFFVYRTTPFPIRVMMGDKWVDEFHELLIDTEEGRAALHWHLLHEVDCTNFDPHGPPPVTEAKQTAQVFSRTEAESYCEQRATELRETDPKRVLLLEEEHANTQFRFREKEFLAAFRKFFTYIGRTLVPFGMPGQRSKKGLWGLKMTAEDLKAKRYGMTLQQARARYEAQVCEKANNKKDVASRKALSND